KAEELETRVLETTKRVLSDKHLDTLIAIIISYLRSDLEVDWERQFYEWSDAINYGKTFLVAIIL
ncbi:hypothetical protein EJ04DRAFT_431949, partial [Polyplosphaeria fusca]